MLNGRKMYAPRLTKLGRLRYGRRLFKRAREAQAYAERWARRAEGLAGLRRAEERIEISNREDAKGAKEGQ